MSKKSPAPTPKKSDSKSRNLTAAERWKWVKRNIVDSDSEEVEVKSKPKAKPKSKKPTPKKSDWKGKGRRLKWVVSDESFDDDGSDDDEDLGDLVEETESEKMPRKWQAKKISEDDFIVEDDEVKPRWGKNPPWKKAPSGWQVSKHVASKVEETKDAPTPLEGHVIVLTGVFERIAREWLDDFLRTLGAKVTGSVSGKTSYLFIGSRLEDGWEVTTGSKYRNAKAKGTPILDET